MNALYKNTILAALVLSPLLGIARDPSAIDRRQYEAMTREWGEPFADDVWQQECARICEQSDEREYLFFERLNANVAQVVNANSSTEAMNALAVLDDLIKEARMEAGFAAAGHIRKVPNTLLDYMAEETKNLCVKRVLEGWLASSSQNYISQLSPVVVDCGFTPCTIMTPGLQEKIDTIIEKGELVTRNGNHTNVFSWRGNPYSIRETMWMCRATNAPRLFKSLESISKEVEKVSSIFEKFGKLNPKSSMAKKLEKQLQPTLKSALDTIDREVNVYTNVQNKKFYDYFDRDEREKLMIQHEVMASHERLLERICEMVATDKTCKGMADARLVAVQKRITTIEKKLQRFK